MKKIYWFMVLLMFMALALVGCKNAGDKNVDVEQQEIEKKDVKAEVPANMADLLEELQAPADLLEAEVPAPLDVAAMPETEVETLDAISADTEEDLKTDNEAVIPDMARARVSVPLSFA